MPFQLVTGMTRIHSTHHVFSKIGLVTPLCLLVLVRNRFFLAKSAFFYYQNMQEPVHALDESMWFLLLSNQSKQILKYHFFVLNFRFAETESTAVLAMLVSHYKITIKEEPQFAGEMFEERKSRILSAGQGLTLTYVLE